MHVNALIRFLLLLTLFPTAGHAHLHVEIHHSNHGWHLRFYDFDSGIIDPADFPLIISPAASSIVPHGNAQLEQVLGRPDSPVWILPEVERPGIPFLGVGTRGISSGVFLNNQIQLRLSEYEGPGHFALYTIDSFGRLRTHMNTRDGIDPETDTLDVPSVSGHLHANWAFSEPGTYRLGFAASGVLASAGNSSTSEVTTFTFIVKPQPEVRIHQIDITPEGLRIELAAPPESNCRLDTSPDLNHWDIGVTFKVPSNGRAFRLIPIPESGSPSPARFVRAAIP